MIGFQLFSIRPGSLLAAIGVQSGDVLRRLNGHALDSPEHGLEIAELLGGATRVVLELERSGRPLRKEYTIDPG